MEDTEIELPLVKLTKQDVLGALFVHTKNQAELYHDALLKLQTWIINFAEEQVKPLRDIECISDDEIALLKSKICVISPFTLSLYFYWLQIESFSLLNDSDKEKRLLNRMPDRFKARYKGNLSCRNAREVSSEEEYNGDDAIGIENDTKCITFVEFLHRFGQKIKQEKSNA